MKIKRRDSFSATNATQGSEARLHQTEHPNAMPATERCPGQPKMMATNGMTFVTHLKVNTEAASRY
jgi:hypothetical protein